MKILLLEDDIVLGESIQEILDEAFYEVDWVQDGITAAEASFGNTYDLYILDINVPEINGFTLLKELRAAADHTPTIFISALTDIKSIGMGFSLGAGDYLKKPFSPEELLIRVASRFASNKGIIKCGSISFNYTNEEIMKNDILLSLGIVQHEFLKLFITNMGKTLRKERFFELMEHPSETALRVAITKLKYATQWNIQNIRGIGYRIDEAS